MKITAFVWVCACAYGHASVRISGGVNAECVRRGVLAHFQSLFWEFSAERHLKGVLRLSFSLCCVRSWIHTRSDLYHSHAPKPPKPHVNLDNGGLGDSGNCCLSVQWKERLSCNGSPVGSVCKLLCTAAVWGVPLSCTSLCYFGWLLDLGGTSSFGGYHCFCQGESVLLLRALAWMRRRDLQRKSSLFTVLFLTSNSSSDYIQPPRL